eukprot:TRINITY_DN34223_c0_g1_i1.p1 TRINITY_DN34223_c0_g1~~TRINITY_DN34223_c0_g1_i1.p1  ORF type:complete len:221 (+),score=3.91 TRINITY_DN34223_c0_g1_i1:53-715(+)
MDGGDNYFKVLVVGNGMVGKTCLISRYVHDVFQISTKATIGVEFLVKEGIPCGNQEVTLQIWDVAGQERYEAMCRVYFQAAMGALVVYDTTNPASFQDAPKWKELIDSKVTLTDGSPIPCILVGNKCDRKPVPPRTPEALDSFCADHGFVGHVLTSAKTNVNVVKTFELLVEHVVKNEERLLETQPTVPIESSIRLHEPPPSNTNNTNGKEKKGKKTGCC